MYFYRMPSEYPVPGIFRGTGGRLGTLRKGVLASLTAFAVAWSGAALAEDHDLSVLRIGKVGNDFTFFPADFGKAKGFYQENGIDLDIYEIGGAQIVQTMITGNADIGLMGGTQVQHIAIDVPISAVGALSNAPYGFVLVIPADGEIDSIEDLRGKTISVSRTRSLTEWVASHVAIVQDWPLSDLDFVGVGGDAERVAAMVTGSVDAALVSLETAFPLVRSGDVEILVSFGEVIPDFHNQLIYASNDVLEARPDDVRAFLEVWYETVAYMKENREEVILAYMDYTQIDRESVEDVFDSLMTVDYMSLDGRISRSAIEQLDAMFVEYEILADHFPVEDYYTEDYLP